MSTSVATNEYVVRRLLEGAFGMGDLSIVDEVVDANLIEHQRGARSGADNLRRMIAGLRAGFPDLTLTIEDIVSRDDKVWARCVGRGTQTGPMMGRPPTGKSMQIDIIDICRVANGEIVEHWGVPDQLGMLEQIGVIPGR